MMMQKTPQPPRPPRPPTPFEQARARSVLEGYRGPLSDRDRQLRTQRLLEERDLANAAQRELSKERLEALLKSGRTKEPERMDILPERERVSARGLLPERPLPNTTKASNLIVPYSQQAASQLFGHGKESETNRLVFEKALKEWDVGLGRGFKPSEEPGGEPLIEPLTPNQSHLADLIEQNFDRIFFGAGDSIQRRVNAEQIARQMLASRSIQEFARPIELRDPGVVAHRNVDAELGKLEELLRTAPTPRLKRFAANALENGLGRLERVVPRETLGDGWIIRVLNGRPTAEEASWLTELREQFVSTLKASDQRYQQFRTVAEEIAQIEYDEHGKPVFGFDVAELRGRFDPRTRSFRATRPSRAVQVETTQADILSYESRQYAAEPRREIVGLDQEVVRIVRAAAESGDPENVIRSWKALAYQVGLPTIPKRSSEKESLDWIVMSTLSDPRAFAVMGADGLKQLMALAGTPYDAQKARGDYLNLISVDGLPPRGGSVPEGSLAELHDRVQNGEMSVAELAGMAVWQRERNIAPEWNVVGRYPSGFGYFAPTPSVATEIAALKIMAETSAESVMVDAEANALFGPSFEMAYETRTNQFGGTYHPHLWLGTQDLGDQIAASPADFRPIIPRLALHSKIFRPDAAPRPPLNIELGDTADTYTTKLADKIRSGYDPLLDWIDRNRYVLGLNGPLDPVGAANAIREGIKNGTVARPVSWESADQHSYARPTLEALWNAIVRAPKPEHATFLEEFVQAGGIVPERVERAVDKQKPIESDGGSYLDYLERMKRATFGAQE